MNRLKQATLVQWIKCGIVIALYLLFLVWIKSWWGLIEAVHQLGQVLVYGSEYRYAQAEIG